jgi:hypothetical protein
MSTEEQLLWNFYESNWVHIKKRCWGKVYAREHQDLINMVNNYATHFGIELDQSKFKPVERHIP